MTPMPRKCSPHECTFFLLGRTRDDRYKLKLDAQKEMMDWDREMASKKLQIQRKKIELEKKEAAMKWELGKAKTFG